MPLVFRVSAIKKAFSDPKFLSTGLQLVRIKKMNCRFCQANGIRVTLPNNCNNTRGNVTFDVSKSGSMLFQLRFNIAAEAWSRGAESKANSTYRTKSQQPTSSRSNRKSRSERVLLYVRVSARHSPMLPPIVWNEYWNSPK